MFGIVATVQKCNIVVAAKKVMMGITIFFIFKKLDYSFLVATVLYQVRLGNTAFLPQLLQNIISQIPPAM